SGGFSSLRARSNEKREKEDDSHGPPLSHASWRRTFKSLLAGHPNFQAARMNGAGLVGVARRLRLVGDQLVTGDAALRERDTVWALRLSAAFPHFEIAAVQDAPRLLQRSARLQRLALEP